MQFFASSQFPWSNSKLPQAAALGAAAGVAGAWHDSSFDLAQGLEVSEEDNDTLYQLWELSHN